MIDWKKGKNVTVKTIKKNQKHKSRGSMRTVTKTVQNESFFHFFSPPTGNFNQFLYTHQSLFLSIIVHLVVLIFDKMRFSARRFGK